MANAGKRELMQRLLQTSGKLPTSSLGRMRRAAGAALRSGRLVFGARKQPDAALDEEVLARIVASLGELKGVAMKAGQLMSYVDIALPDELANALSVLQTHAQPMESGRVEALIRDELGDRAGELLDKLDPVPVAAASIGQVHRAELADGTPVAVKVQYPEVARAIRADFGPAAVGVGIVSLIYPNARAEDFIQEARARFLEECDYLHEARCQARFARLFENHPHLRVPAVFERLCSRGVLTTAWMPGAGFDEFLESNPDQHQRNRIGEALFEFYIGTLFKHGLYNCDPHPGNYLFQPDGRVVMLDYGCTREFEPDYVDKLARLTRAAQSDAHDALEACFIELGMVREGQDYDFSTARDLVRSFYGPMLHDRVQRIDLGEAMSMRRLADGKRELMKLGVPGEFLFLFRIRFGLMSVLARLGAEANWYRLEQAYVGTRAEERAFPAEAR